MPTPAAADIDTYIARYAPPVQDLLRELRAAVRAAAPEAEETISYGMPAFRQDGILVYFAAYARHIGFYPTGSGIEAFKDEFAGYAWSKGAVQFPLDRPLPVDLVRRIVQFRVEENRNKAGLRRGTRR